MDKSSPSPQEQHIKALSQDSNNLPLSPVLGSGESIKKLLRNRKRQKKGKKSVAQKLEAAFTSNSSLDNERSLTESELNESLLDIGLLEDSTGSSSRTHTVSKQESLIESIKKLDALELQRNNIIKTISVHSSVPAKSNIQANCPEMLALKSTVKPSKENNEEHTNDRTKPNKTEANSSKSINNVTVSTIPAPENIPSQAFQTCTGKIVNWNSEQIENSKKLFGDILEPGQNIGARKKKFNYLNADKNNIKGFDIAKVHLEQSRCTENSHIISNDISTVKSNLEQRNNPTVLEQEKELCFNQNFPAKTIFEGENFHDLKPEQFVGFRLASKELNVKITAENTSELQTTQDATKRNKTEANFRAYSPEIIASRSINNVKESTILHPDSIRQGFQTCTEKIVNHNSEQIENSKKLFDDKLEPGQNVGAREKKLNYLASDEKQIKGFDGVEVHLEQSRCISNDISTVKSNLNLLEQRNNPTVLEQERKLCFNENFPAKQIFMGENFNDLKIEKFVGFRFASKELNVKTADKNISELQPTNEKQEPQIETKVLRQLPPQSQSKKPKVSNFKPPLLKSPEKNLYESDLNLKNVESSSATLSNSSNLREKITPLKTPSTDLFAGESFDDLKADQFCMFQKASLASLKSPKKSVNNVTLAEGQNGTIRTIPSHTYEPKMQKRNIFNGESFDDLKVAQPCMFQLASFKTDPEKGMKNTVVSGSVTASTNQIQQKKPSKNIFEGENFDDLFKNKPDTRNYSRTLKTISPRSRNIFEGENFDNLNVTGIPGFAPTKFKSSASTGFQKFQSPLKTPAITSQNNCDNNFKGFCLDEQQNAIRLSSILTQIISGIEQQFQLCDKNTEVPLIKMDLVNDILKANLGLSKKRKFSEIESDHNSLSHTPLQGQPKARPKKRLGCSFSPTIRLSETGFKRSKLIFEDLEPKPNTSTPVKFYGETTMRCDLTPIQSITRSTMNVFSETLKTFSMNETLKAPNKRFSLNKPTPGDVRAWLDELANQRRLLEERLHAVKERETILMNQGTILHYSVKGRARILPGVLFQAKQSTNRVSLREFVTDLQPGDNPSDNNFLTQINPQNAHLVHFYVCDNISHIVTQDGATIVPNAESRVGLSEIEHSFKSLESVDPHLLPKGWVQNHYRWIVWKLASYERMYKDRFEECLTVENVMQQLKYRYDLEIDNAKRPTLRKIFEKDDCSQRRMILCVSKVIKTINTYELELTDGWYPIRTVVDALLSNQIAKGKIKIGTKLIIYGAELKNCDGCHPLEATESIHLQINYNCTRRCLWWCKLGGQRISGPFLVPLSSIDLNGGKIGRMKCFIVRVYPVKYLEKYGAMNVWRNRKAEERREQEFYNEKFKRSTSVENKAHNYKNVRDINDPEILYDILQRSNDPEGLEDSLSNTQKSVLYNYSINRPNRSTSSSKERNVTALLKIKLVDASGDPSKVYDFNVWKPAESHFDELKEGAIVTIFNVACSPKWGFSASNSTQFKRENCQDNLSRFEQFRRQTTWIEDLGKENVGFLKEVDTVGLVVKKTITEVCQEVWLADHKQRLLYIRIADLPKNILVLDATNEGQIVSVCNIVMKKTCRTHSYAVGDHFVVFARYSQHRHLQEAVKVLEEQFSGMDKHMFVQQCQHKVQSIKDQTISNNFLSSRI